MKTACPNQQEYLLSAHMQMREDAPGGWLGWISMPSISAGVQDTRWQDAADALKDWLSSL